MLNFSSEKCNGCGLCVNDCKMLQNIVLDTTKKARILNTNCINCYHCIAICPNEAITVDNIITKSERYSPTFTSQEYLEFLKNKRSIRQYKEQVVESSKIEHIIEAGIYSPTAGNRQPVHYAVVTGERLKELTKLTLETLKGFADDYYDGKIELNLNANSAKRYTSMWKRFYTNYFDNGIDELFFNAPCLLLIMGDTEKTSDPKTDCLIASCNIGNMVFASGLGFCYNGFFVRAYQSEEIRNFLGLEKKFNLYSAMTIGYPNVEYRRVVLRDKKDIFWI
jgi:nitroreductase/Pyruvate/2-oxoacid:ferredoxin oxidoreductase delta subunit